MNPICRRLGHDWVRKGRRDAQCSTCNRISSRGDILDGRTFDEIDRQRVRDEARIQAEIERERLIKSGGAPHGR